MAILSVRHLTKTFGGVTAVNGLNMDVEEKTVTMIIGPNGSGKTTLVNMIFGILRPDSGNIIFDNVDITGWPAHRVYARGLARTFQIPAPFSKLTVLENLLVENQGHPGESYLRAPIRSTWINTEKELTQQAFRIIDMLNLNAVWDKPAATLSGGQLKLLELGRALMSKAKMIIMDEPIAGVNPTLAHQVFSHMIDLKDRLGITFLFIEHRLEIAVPYVQKIYAMGEGRVISEGSPDKVLKDGSVMNTYLGL